MIDESYNVNYRPTFNSKKQSCINVTSDVKAARSKKIPQFAFHRISAYVRAIGV